MKRIQLILIFVFGTIGFNQAQNFLFKVRKVPQLKYHVFSDKYNHHNLDEKTNEEQSFPLRLYIQVYDNDTFLIRWCNWQLTEASNQLDYLNRDSLTFAGKVSRSGEEDLKLVFPFKDQTCHMFSISEEPLIISRTYRDKENVERVNFGFTYNGQNIFIADLLKEDVEGNEEIVAALKLSARIKLGFYSEDLYNSEKVSTDLPFNIVNTFPVQFIIDHSSKCDSKLFSSGVTTTQQIRMSDTASYRADKDFINALPEANLIRVSDGQFEYYTSRRYVYLESDSQVVVSDLNDGCAQFYSSLDTLPEIETAEFWKADDGVNNYLVRVSDDYWGYVSKYGCTLTWRIYTHKSLRKILKKQRENIFQAIQKVKFISETALDKTCDSGT